MSRVVLDLCAGTGAWSEPYRVAGYEVQRITVPAHDVRTYRPPRTVHGIMAAPPCQHFSNSGARWWRTKGDPALLEGLSVVLACLRIIAQTAPAWWALENPTGRLGHYLGPPALVFDPCDYGDPYTKRTLLWGRFAKPVPLALRVMPEAHSRIHWMPPGPDRQAKRSVTPPGFAQAFFDANP